MDQEESISWLDGENGPGNPWKAAHEDYSTTASILSRNDNLMCRGILPFTTALLGGVVNASPSLFTYFTLHWPLPLFPPTWGQLRPFTMNLGLTRLNTRSTCPRTGILFFGLFSFQSLPDAQIRLTISVSTSSTLSRSPVYNRAISPII